MVHCDKILKAWDWNDKVKSLYFCEHIHIINNLYYILLLDGLKFGKKKVKIKCRNGVCIKNYAERSEAENFFSWNSHF